MNPPTVSVIMPAYNTAPWIREAVASVQAQTAPDWELVVVNDGATDGTGAILEQLAIEDPRIHVLSQSRSGVSAARNAGMDAARGSHIAFLDSDDLWAPGFLDAMLITLGENPGVGVVWCDFTRFDDTTGKEKPVAWRNYTVTGNTFHDMLIHVETCINCLLIRRRGPTCQEPRFDTDLTGAEDLDFMLRLFRSLPAIHLARTLCRVRLRGSGASANYRRMLDDEALMLERYLNLKDVPEPVRRRARSMFAFQRAVTLAFGGREIAEALNSYIAAVRLEPLNPNLYLLPLRKLWLSLTAGLGGRTCA